MIEPNQAPMRLELEESDIFSQYFLYSRAEIVFVLREAAQKNRMMTVYFDMGHSFFLSSVLEVSPEGLIIDCSNQEETNQKALSTARLLCTMSVDQVKVQFALNGVRRTFQEGKPAFWSALPTSLLRLQRREHFRIPTPAANPLICQIPIPSDAEGAPPLCFPLLDLSVGGMGLKVEKKDIARFSYDALFEACVLSLPEAEQVKFGLGVRTVLEINTNIAHPHFRVGCEFVDCPRSLPILIQRYITALERERKARLSGLE
ncbi:MAG: flagellar brake protein [Zoogloeaceae bacterium]|nr:flagellar brake protein [Zoogloeaceae bacterium]